MTMALRAGILRHRVTLEESVETRSADGGVVVGYQPKLSGIPAYVEELSGRELIEARQIHERVRSKVTLRYLRGLTTAHRFDFRGRKLSILDVVQSDGVDIMHECMVVEDR